MGPGPGGATAGGAGDLDLISGGGACIGAGDLARIGMS